MGFLFHSLTAESSRNVGLARHHSRPFDCFKRGSGPEVGALTFMLRALARACPGHLLRYTCV